jgi:hypothetical protein
LISFREEKLLQAVIGHSEGEISNIEFCHTFFLLLVSFNVPKMRRNRCFLPNTAKLSFPRNRENEEYFREQPTLSLLWTFP